LVVTNVSGYAIGPVFKDPAVKEETAVTTNLRCVISQQSEDLNLYLLKELFPVLK
jgi:hypothetical protein